MLETGNSLVVYSSDSVVECRDPGGEDFGLDRLIAALPRPDSSRLKAPSSAACGCTRICQRYPMSDDMGLTLIHGQADELAGRE